MPGWPSAGKMIILAGPIFVLSACSGGAGIRVARESFDGDWPFTVQEGTLSCEGAGAVTFSANGTTYAVNGTARGSTSYPDVDPIWADDPTSPGLKINIGDIIRRGLELCD